MIIANRYQLKDEIGQGGMGTVYRGVDTQTGDAIAIKLLNPQVVMSDPGIVERFRREAEALRQLNHPNIVKVMDTIEAAGGHYIVMEYVTGGSLHDLLRQHERIPVRRVMEIALDLADALTRAHRLRIIHRDIKPANVLLAEDNSPRLTDFGVAHMGTKERVTTSGTAIGTFDYLPPEALNGAPVDARTDIWAFGVLLFEMLVGQRPFQGNTISHLLTNILSQPTPDLETLCPTAPVALVDLVYRMLQKDPHARISSVRQVGLELEAIIQGEHIAVTTPNDTSKIPPLPAAFTAPTPTPGKSPHNLPAQTTPFVGREIELAALARMLDDPGQRLMTILAPGGMGKTRLALEAAGQQISKFAHGVYFVPLAPISAIENIVPTIAEAVGFQFTQDEREPQQQLLDFFREKQMLLVMDNFEHMLDGAAIASTILNTAPDVQVLATSRERLNMSGETIFNLGGMDFPDWETPEDALEYSAVKLFMQGAVRAQPGFTLQTDDLTYVARVCRLVRGMPLGIVLAAAWVEMLSLEEIASEITQSMDFLETEMRDMPERHRSIRAVFDYSWNLLTDSEREVFARLSVFRGGMTREAAQQVAGANLRTLTALVNKSLLRRDPDSGRYEVHELLRQYAEEQLQSAGAADSTRDSHSAYYLTRVSQREDDLVSSGQMKIIHEFKAEMDNIRSGLWWAVERGSLDIIPAALQTLVTFYEMLNWFQEGTEVFTQLEERLLQAGIDESSPLMHKVRLRKEFLRLRLGHYAEGRAVALEVLEQYQDQDGAARGDVVFAYVCLCYIAMMQGQYDDARHYGEKGLAIGREINDLFGIAGGLFNLGYVAYLAGDYEEGIRIHQDAIRLTEERGSPPMLTAFAFNNLGEIYHALARAEEAKQLFEKAFALFREAGNRRGMAFTLNNLGNVAHAMADFESATNYNQRSLAIYREVGDRRGTADALRRLGDVSYTIGRYQEAIDYHQESLTISRQMGDQRGVANALILLGPPYIALGNYEKALACGHESLEIRRQMGNPSEIADALQMLALGTQFKGDIAAAHQFNDESLRVIEQAGVYEPQIMGRYYMFRAILLLFEDKFAESRSILETLKDQLEELGIRWSIVQAYLGLGMSCFGMGDLEESWDYFQKGLRIGWEIRTLDWVIFIIAGMALVRIEWGHVEEGIELLAFTLDYPSSLHFVRQRVTASMETVKDRLAPEDFAAAVERGKKLEIAAVIEQLLALG